MERVTGIEPALSAWEADVLPLNYTRRRSKPYLTSALTTALQTRLLEGDAVPGAHSG